MPPPVAYISKSFYCIGNNLTSCFGCSYCRVGLGSPEFEFNQLPTNINPNFNTIPVAVNLFYGDPLIQSKNTNNILSKLDIANHKGPVIIITKGDLKKAIDDGMIHEFIDLDLHLAFSTFGMKHKYDKLSHLQLVKNLKIADKKLNFRKSIEFRPICYGINDSKKIIEEVFKIANDYNVAIGYSGLQGTVDMVKHWKAANIKLEPYPGFKFGHKKSISIEVQTIFDEMSAKYEVPIFRKTSCLISYVHGLNRDYNAHYYRPNEMNCDNCKMKTKCFDFKSKLSSDKTIIEHLIPFEFEIVTKEKHECILKKNNICEYPSGDCSNINGKIIKINEDISTADVRVIKWLTGYTVDANFKESFKINSKWNKIK